MELKSALENFPHFRVGERKFSGIKKNIEYHFIKKN